MIIRCIDFETTGFPPRANVCEAGWTDLIVTDAGVTMGDTMSYLCNPGLPIGKEAMRVHGITEEMVAHEPPSATIFMKVMQGADIFCAHNAQFEQNFFSGGGKPWICTYKVALSEYPALPNHRNGTIPEHLGIKLDPDRAAPLHRAGPDTYVTAKILWRLLGDGLTVRRMVEITSAPKIISRMPQGKGKYPGVEIRNLPRDYLEWAAKNYPIEDFRRALSRELRARNSRSTQ
jgi:exodeoxyribonuclease X